ncbi:hypothetical protein [Kitasatospora sp. NPDC093558]|uniref:hypothetical protein n=1 Tax=Kitasatospora sp. NPDC093558 TaxID=3155201 RepID=UPI003414646D
MRIEIVDVLDGGRVVFRSDLGRAQAVWAGPPTAAPGQLFDAELDVEEPVLAWAKAAGPAAIVEAPAGGVVLTGTVLAAGDADDPVVDLAVGGDIVMLERPVDGETDDRADGWVDGWDAAPGDVVAVRVASLRLYPYEL